MRPPNEHQTAREYRILGHSSPVCKCGAQLGNALATNPCGDPKGDTVRVVQPPPVEWFAGHRL